MSVFAGVSLIPKGAWWKGHGRWSVLHRPWRHRQWGVVVPRVMGGGWRCGPWWCPWYTSGYCSGSDFTTFSWIFMNFHEFRCFCTFCSDEHEKHLLSETLKTPLKHENTKIHWNSLKFTEIRHFCTSNGQKLSASSCLTGERPVSEMSSVLWPLFDRSAAVVNETDFPTALVFKRCYPWVS